MRKELVLGGLLVLLLALPGLVAASVSNRPAGTVQPLATLPGGNECFGVVVEDSSGLWIDCRTPCNEGCVVVITDLGGGYSFGACTCGEEDPNNCCKAVIVFFEGAPFNPGNEGDCFNEDPSCSTRTECTGFGVGFPNDTNVFQASCKN